MHRICPGMFFAMNSIFIGIATMLYIFKISKSKDKDGNEIVPVVDFRGFIRCVLLVVNVIGLTFVDFIQSSRPIPMQYCSEI